MESIAVRYAYTLGDEIVSEYRNLNEIWESFYKSVRSVEDLESSYYDEELFYKVCESAGKLQTMLDEELISIRDSE